MAFGLRSRRQSTTLVENYHRTIAKESEEKEKAVKLLRQKEAEIKKLKIRIKQHEENIATTQDLLNPIVIDRDRAEKLCCINLIEALVVNYPDLF